MNGVLDTTLLVETPEGIDLQAELAGPVPRMLAYLIDVGLRAAVMLGASIALGLLGKAGTGLMALLAFLLEWFYPVLFEVLRGGQTPGKRQLDLVTLHEDLSPITWSSSLLRNLLRVADFLPVFYLAGLASMCLGTRFQRLGDLAAGTVVVHRIAQPPRAEVPEAAPVPPPFALEAEDQQALIGFAQRHQRLSADRQRELAAILAPPLRADSGASALARLHGIARWLLGER